jgi:DNA-binding NtrC family response regulator
VPAGSHCWPRKTSTWSSPICACRKWTAPQFLEKVRAGWPRAIRILLTGYADIASTVNAINKGEIYRYVSKPWDDNDIVLMVRDALQSQRLQSENTRLLALTQSPERRTQSAEQRP